MKNFISSTYDWFTCSYFHGYWVLIDWEKVNDVVFIYWFTGEILAKIDESGFNVAREREIHLTREEAEEFYKEQQGLEYFEQFITNLSRWFMQIYSENDFKSMIEKAKLFSYLKCFSCGLKNYNNSCQFFKLDFFLILIECHSNKACNFKGNSHSMEEKSIENICTIAAADNRQTLPA